MQTNSDDRLIYRIFMAQQKLRTHIKNVLIKEGVTVTLPQSGILFLLEQNDGRSMTELAQPLGIDNSTITGLIDRLEKAGFVQRRPNNTDRRMLRIHITEKGREEAGKARPVIQKINEEIKAGFTPTEIETFKNVLNSLVDRL